MRAKFVKSRGNWVGSLLAIACLFGFVSGSATFASGQALDRLKPLDILPNLDKSEVSTLVDLQTWNGRSAVLLKLLNRLPAVPTYLYEQV